MTISLKDFVAESIKDIADLKDTVWYSDDEREAIQNKADVELFEDAMHDIIPCYLISSLPKSLQPEGGYHGYVDSELIEWFIGILYKSGDTGRSFARIVEKCYESAKFVDKSRSNVRVIKKHATTESKNKKRPLRKVSEEITHSKDGVWLHYFSGLNTDHYYVEVWKDGEKVEGQDKYSNGVGTASYRKALEIAQEKSKEYGLPIIDGTGAAYFTFPSEYKKTKSSVSDDDFEKYGIERHEYSDDEIYGMDERPEKTSVWARYIAPGKFEGLENKAKNPSRLYDVRAIRMFDSDYREYSKDMEKYMDEHSDNLREYTWDEIKDTNYVILKDGKAFTDKVIREQIKSITEWELSFVDGEKRKKLTSNGFYRKKKTYRDYEDEEWEEQLKNLKNVLILDYGMESSENKMKITYLIDLLEITGIEVPEEFEVEYKDYDWDKDENKHTAKFKKGDQLDKWYDDEGVLRPAVGMVLFNYKNRSDDWRERDFNRDYKIRGDERYVVVAVEDGKAYLANCTNKKLTYKGTWGNEYELLYDADAARDALRSDPKAARNKVISMNTSIGKNTRWALDVESTKELGEYSGMMTEAIRRSLRNPDAFNIKEVRKQFTKAAGDVLGRKVFGCQELGKLYNVEYPRSVIKDKYNSKSNGEEYWDDWYDEISYNTGKKQPIKFDKHWNGEDYAMYFDFHGNVDEFIDENPLTRWEEELSDKFEEVARKNFPEITEIEVHISSDGWMHPHGSSAGTLEYETHWFPGARKREPEDIPGSWDSRRDDQNLYSDNEYSSSKGNTKKVEDPKYRKAVVQKWIDGGLTEVLCNAWVKIRVETSKVTEDDGLDESKKMKQLKAFVKDFQSDPAILEMKYKDGSKIFDEDVLDGKTTYPKLFAYLKESKDVYGDLVQILREAI